MTCALTGPLQIQDIKAIAGSEGHEVFSERKGLSLFQNKVPNASLVLGSAPGTASNFLTAASICSSVHFAGSGFMLVEAGMCIKVRSHSGLHLQTLRVRRLYDDKNNTLLYVAYSTRLDGSQNVCPSTCYPSYFVVGDGLQLQSCSPPSCICWCMASHANTSTWLHAVLRKKGGRWGGGVQTC